MKKILTLTIISLSVLIAIAFCFVKPIDRTPLKESLFYQREMMLIDSVKRACLMQQDYSEVMAGWASINLLPTFTTPIAIDAARGGKHFEGVYDSIYVRAFVFKAGIKKTALVSADLLIIPPKVVQIVDSILLESGFSSENIFYTATHTHSSIGGWQEGYIGEVFAGEYDPRVPAHIADRIVKAILKAEKQVGECRFGYKEIPTTDIVFNRLVGDSGQVDSLLRIIKLEKADHTTAAIITYSAHCTIFHEKMMNISGDWAGTFMQMLKDSAVCTFPSFSAGAVGSHGPVVKYKSQEQQINYTASRLYNCLKSVFDTLETKPVFGTSMIHLPLFLREPQFRITNQFAIRPWLFHKLLAYQKIFVNQLELGEITLTGMPCDFSGELVCELKKKDSKVPIVTSFNGGFIGYITADKWYNLDSYETRTMSWFGQENGSYFKSILHKLNN